MYVLGIDGGGTKTTAVIADSSGRVLASARAGATNPRTQPAAEVKRQFERIHRMLHSRNDRALTAVQSLFCGVAGVAETDEKRAMQEMLHAIFGPIPITVDHDALSALYSGTGGEAGIVSVSGTGSITFGRNENGVVGRVGGWGYLMGDEGSGYAIGRTALQRLMAEIDAGHPPSALSETIVAHYGLSAVSDVKAHIYQAADPRACIASVAGVVGSAADQGSEDARHILAASGHALARQIVTLAKRLFQRRRVETVERLSEQLLERPADQTAEQSPEQSLPIVLTGSVYKSAQWIRPAMETYMCTNFTGAYHFIQPQVPPVAGALLRGFQLARVQASTSFLAAVERGLQSDHRTTGPEE